FLFVWLFFLLIPLPPRSTLFPYTTLFRSAKDLNDAIDLSFAPDQRVEFAFEGGFGQVAAEFEEVRSLFAGVRVAFHVGLPHEVRSEEHTSELQSLTNIVCRLLLEKKKTPR